MNPIAPYLPHLPTLDLPASWRNRAGRVDRSACLELRASEIRSHARLQTRRSSAGLEAAGSFTITARFLYNLHRTRLPRQLVGDLRTTKSNVMRPNLPSPSGRGAGGEGGLPPPCQGGGQGVGEASRCPDAARAGDGRARLEPANHATDSSTPQASTSPRRHIRIHPPGPAPNPNKGATRTKMLGLHAAGDAPGIEEDWQQTIRVERHRIHANLARHFLICPACARSCGKLFMVLCTEAECLDAELAEGWIRMLDARYDAVRKPIPADLLAIRDKLINRYGLIFRGRRLLCRNCLDLRYGEHRASLKTPSTASSLAAIPTERQRYALNLMQYIITSNQAIRTLQSELRALEKPDGKRKSPHALPRKTIPVGRRPRHSIFKPLPRPPRPPQRGDAHP